MSVNGSSQRRSSARRAGYVMAAVVNALVLYAVNGWPGWRAAPLVTTAAISVIPLLNASIVAGIVVNVVNALVDRRGIKAVGDLVTTCFAAAVLLRLWQVFPFDVTGAWKALVQVLLVVAGLGCLVGLVVGALAVVRAVVRATAGRRPPTRVL